MSETPDEETYVEATLTCHTEGCGNAGVPLTLLMPEGGAAECGVCRQPIEDIS